MITVDISDTIPKTGMSNWVEVYRVEDFYSLRHAVECTSDLAKEKEGNDFGAVVLVIDRWDDMVKLPSYPIHYTLDGVKYESWCLALEESEDYKVIEDEVHFVEWTKHLGLRNNTRLCFHYHEGCTVEDLKVLTEYYNESECQSGLTTFKTMQIVGVPNE